MRDKKKILFISAFPVNSMTAGQNYSLRLIEKLSNIYSIDLIYFEYSNHISQADKYVSNIIKVKLKFFNKMLGCVLFFFLFPFYTVRFNPFVLAYILKNEKKYDLIYLDFSQSFIYSLFIKNTKLVQMTHDVIFQKYSRSFNKMIFKNIILLLIYYSEKLFFSSKSKIFTFSIKDCRLIKKLYSIDSLKTDFFIDEKIKSLSTDDYFYCYDIAFFGAWNRNENISGLNWFLNTQIEKVTFLFPNIKIVIIGGGMPNHIIAKLKKYDQITYVGYMENPYNIISKSKILLAPIFSGAGVKVKVVEALSIGINVLGTTISFEGIPKISKNQVFLFNKNNFINELQKIMKLNYNKIEIFAKHNYFLTEYNKTSIEYWLKENLK